MTAPAVTTTYGEPDKDGWRSIKAECAQCDYTAFTGASTVVAGEWVLRDHLKQHAPGRALDIEVDWTPSADCSVCDDGGDVAQEDDGLRCRDCGTCWSIDGSGGYLDEGGES